MTKFAERQITSSRKGHILTNTRVWSPKGDWIVYDTRSTPAGDFFDGETIELVQVRTGETRTVFQSTNGAHCGVATFHPRENKVIFILGPENPTVDWQYCAWHRQGVIVDCAIPGQAINLDARDLTPPFTPGALRGGSHVHVWDPAGEWVSFTYEDDVLAGFQQETAEQEMNLRNIGVSAPVQRVEVSRDHPRNHGGEFFSVLVTRTVGSPAPGSDQISKAFEEGWIGTNGYLRADGTRQKHALAFQGLVRTSTGKSLPEVFIADLPDDLRVAGEGPLAGTQTRRPFPPKGTTQRRLTFTAARKYPGLQGPRHWLRSSPNGICIAFLMKDDAGIVQLWTISPLGGPPTQLTHNSNDIASTFTWSPDGSRIAHVMDGSVCVTDTVTGQTTRLTDRSEEPKAPRPEACVFAPDGKQIAYVRPVWMQDKFFNQIFVAAFEN
jgi:WD40 repeat protein